MKRISIDSTLILLFPLFYICNAVSGQQIPWRFSATVESPSTFPFPEFFEAEKGIVLYDTNDDGFIETYTIGDRDEVLPFSYNNPLVRIGSRIGSPIIKSTSNPSQAVQLGPFCGDILIYVEDFIGDNEVLIGQFPYNRNTTYFMWFALRDISRPLTQNCNDFFVDYGIGSYEGRNVLNAQNIHHGTFVGDYLYLNVPQNQSLHSDICISFGNPGSISGPGNFLSNSYQNCVNSQTTLPQRWGFFTVAEALPTGGYNRMVIRNVLIDLPFVDDTQWDGQTLFSLSTQFGRTLQGINGQSSLLARSPSNPVKLWTPYFRDLDGWKDEPSYWNTIKFADINGDQLDDVCGRSPSGVLCALSTGDAFGVANNWTSDFGGSYWETSPSYWQTIRFPDPNGDGNADICGRGEDGIYCALSNGRNFFSTLIRMTNDYSDRFGWKDDPSYWKTIQFPDLNNDGRDDICGRGSGGIVCGISTGGAYNPKPDLWTESFRDADGWKDHPSYWQTIEFPDVNGDGKADVCGRGVDGLYCALSNGRSFGRVRLWSNYFSDRNGWKDNPSKWQTIQFADINRDRKMDVCARTEQGVVCALSNGTGFNIPVLWTSEFRNEHGWNSKESLWQTIRLIDVNGDQRADICGRGNEGIYCCLSNGSGFDPVQLWAKNFGNNNSWDSSPAYWKTVQPANVSPSRGFEWCGRGIDGIWCSFR